MYKIIKGYERLIFLTIHLTSQSNYWIRSVERSEASLLAKLKKVCLSFWDIIVWLRISSISNRKYISKILIEMISSYLLKIYRRNIILWKWPAKLTIMICGKTLTTTFFLGQAEWYNFDYELLKALVSCFHITANMLAQKPDF